MKEKLAAKCTSKFLKSREICRLLHPTVYLQSKREQQYFAIFFWQFCCAQFRGGVSLLIRQSSLFQKTPDWQLPREDTIFISQCLMSESINFNSFSNTSRLAHEPWRQYRCFCGISLTQVTAWLSCSGQRFSIQATSSSIYFTLYFQNILRSSQKLTSRDKYELMHLD